MKTLKDRLIEKMSQPGFSEHKCNMTRRELLGLGLLVGGAAVMPLGFFSKALAETGVTSPSIPFLTFDLVGGISMPGNFLVGGPGGPEDFVDYRAHGWNPKESDAIDRTFGLPMAKHASKILEGIKANLPKQILSDPKQRFVQMASFCHFSLDDTDTNRISALTAISKAGLKGRYLKSGIGTMPSDSGGNSASFLDEPQYKPKYVSSVQQLMNATSFGDAFAQLNPSVRASVFARLRKAAAPLPELRSAYAGLSMFGVPEARMNPSTNSAIASLYGLDKSNDLAVEAAVVYNCLVGNVGPSCLTTSGCDYHNLGQVITDAKDLEIGQRIGRAIAAAHILKKPFMFNIVTDGGVYAKTSDSHDRIWQGDANQHSLSVLGYYDPRGNVELRKPQVGAYTSGGQVDQNTLIGPKPDRMALATIVNYLHLQGLAGSIEALTGIRAQSNEIDEFLVFG